jgi:hypothetical protein
LSEAFVGQSEYANREKAGVSCPVHCYGGDWDTSWHLDHREQGVETAQVLEGDRHADDRERRGCGQHAGEVGSSTGACYQHLLSVTRGCAGVRQGVVRGAMSRQDPNLDLDTEFAQDLDGRVHDLGVRRAAHDDPYCHLSSSGCVLFN